MRYAAFTLTLIQCGLSELAFAQAGHDPAAQLEGCAQKDRAERLECLDQLSRRLAQQPASAPTATGSWVLSETTSPVNYSALVIATTPSRPDSEGAPSLLSISCRNGRTELAITDSSSSGPSRGTDEVMVAHRVNDQPEIRQRWTMSANRKGISFGGDVAGFLRSLPDQGELSVRVFDRQGVSRDGRFLLDGINVVREKVAAACRWPGASITGAPRP